MCAAWCTWQRLNGTRMMVQAKFHLDVCMELFRDQADGGRFFSHEHPASADSWEEPIVKIIWSMDGVEVVTADQCQYNRMLTFGMEKGTPVKTPTGFVNNAPALLNKLSKRCQGQGGWCSAKPAGGMLSAAARWRRRRRSIRTGCARLSCKAYTPR